MLLTGTREERGLTRWAAQLDDSAQSDGSNKASTYDLPFGMSWLRK